MESSADAGLVSLFSKLVQGPRRFWSSELCRWTREVTYAGGQEIENALRRASGTRDWDSRSERQLEQGLAFLWIPDLVGPWWDPSTTPQRSSSPAQPLPELLQVSRALSPSGILSKISTRVSPALLPPCAPDRSEVLPGSGRQLLQPLSVERKPQMLSLAPSQLLQPCRCGACRW